MQAQRDPLIGKDCFTKVNHYYQKGHHQVQHALELDERREPSIDEYNACLVTFQQGLNVQVPGRGENQTKANKLKDKIRRNVSQIKGRIDDLKSEATTTTTTSKSNAKKKQPARPPPSKASLKRNGPDKLTIPGIDKAMIERILGELLTPDSKHSFDRVIGNEAAKQALRDMIMLPAIRPDLFTGLLAPAKGLLLYGPPGNGKTLLVKALAAEMPDCNFFSISASSLTSKWVGDGEKMVKALFAVARFIQPTIIFIDEIDSLLTTRESSSESLRRLQTEFLVQFDGAATSSDDKVTIIGATNLPHELDEAVLRRFPKRIHIPLPNEPDRERLLHLLLAEHRHKISKGELRFIASKLDGYSSSDITQLAKDAATAPLRELSSEQIQRIKELRGLECRDFADSMQRIRPSTTKQTTSQLAKWTQLYGHQ